MARRLKLLPLTQEAFAPFGRVLVQPTNGRLDLIEELENARANAKARLSLATLEPVALPYTATEMEVHPFSSQAFVPVDLSRFIVLVAPGRGDGGPDTDRMQAFVCDRAAGIMYAANVWHHPMRVLDRQGSFAVLTFVDGTADDETFVPLAEPVVIDVAHAQSNKDMTL
jgi:ureidoglycolate lyase